MAKRRFKLKANLGASAVHVLTIGADGRQLQLREGDVHETSDAEEIRELEGSDAVRDVTKGEKD